MAFQIRILLIVLGTMVPLVASIGPVRAEEAKRPAGTTPAAADEAEGWKEEAAAEKAADAAAEAKVDSMVVDPGLEPDVERVLSEPEVEYVGEEGNPAPPDHFPAASHYDMGFSYQLPSDVEDGGHFYLWQGFVNGVYDVDFAHVYSVVARFDYNAEVYSFENTPDVNGFPLLQWGFINIPRFAPLLAFDVHDDWRIYVGPDFELSFESGANIREGFKPGGLAAVEWTLNDDLRVGLGVIAVADLDSKAYVSPILLLDWILTDSLALHMESWSTRGGEAELCWRVLDQLELAANVGYRRELYRLAERDDGAPPTPGPGPMPIEISNGLAQDRAFTGGVRVSWLPQWGFVKHTAGDLRVDLDVTAVFAGELTVWDTDETKLSEQTYDATPAVGLTFFVPF